MVALQQQGIYICYLSLFERGGNKEFFFAFKEIDISKYTYCSSIAAVNNDNSLYSHTSVSYFVQLQQFLFTVDCNIQISMSLSFYLNQSSILLLLNFIVYGKCYAQTSVYAGETQEILCPVRILYLFLMFPNQILILCRPGTKVVMEK